MTMHKAMLNTAVTLLAAAMLAVAGNASAQPDRPQTPEPKYRIPGTPAEPDRTQRQTGLTERTFNLLTSIHSDIGDEKYAEARERLINLRERVRGNDYERALVTNNLGMVHAMLERNREAIRYFEESLEIDALSHRETQRMMMVMAQLYAIEDDWDNSVRMLRRYFYWEDRPDAEAMILMATGFAQKGEFANGIVWVKRAIEAASTPRENWYQLWLALHFELRELDEAADVLARMIAHWPAKPIYWEQLSGILMQLNREADSLAVLSMAHQRGLLEDEDKILNLARYYMYREAPYKAARIIQEGIENGRIERTRANLELLSQAYQMAQEVPRAIEYLRMAAARADDGELYVRVAQMHAMLDDWDGVQRATRDALDKGGLRRPGRAWMMIGMAAYENKDYQEALRAFRQAREFPDERRRANQWIQYINEELRIQRELRAGN